MLNMKKKRILLCVLTSLIFSSTTFSDAEDIIKVPYVEVDELNDISYLQQDISVRKLLEQKGYKFDKDEVKPRILASYAIDYIGKNDEEKIIQLALKHENNQKKITELSALLLKPLGAYGSEKKEKISFSQKISVINEWLTRSILGMSFTDWILNEVSKIKLKEDHSLLTNGELEKRFRNFLNSKDTDGLGILSQAGVNYYDELILKEDMPSFLLHLKKEDDSRLQNMNLDSIEFGYLHVGLNVLKECEIISENIDDIIDVGIFIESLILEGIVKNPELFELPAKVYFTCILNSETPPNDTLGSYYEEYFNHVRKSNSFIQLMEPLNNWKTRTQLAKQILKENDISDDLLKAYLFNGDSEKTYFNNRGEEVVLTGIDNLFESQNINVRESFRKLDKLMLVQAFNSMNEEDKKFLQQAEISFATASFTDKNFFAPGFVVPGQIVKTGDLPQIHLEADNIALLYCLRDNYLNVYALDSRTYELQLVSYDVEKYQKLYNITKSLEGYKVHVDRIHYSTLKEKGQSVNTLVDKLNEIHTEKLYQSLKITGYEATGWQKVKDFLLSLIPFYTCIKEFRNGNTNDAELFCSFDVLSFIPLIGEGIKVGYRFGTTLGEVTTEAVILASKQASMYQMLRQFSKYLVTTGISELQKTVSTTVLRSFGVEFLKAIDPGIGLLKLGGKTVIRTIEQGYKYLKKGFTKLERVVEKLAQGAEKELRLYGLLSADALKTKHVIILPNVELEVTVVKIGEKNGGDILIRIESDTEIPFGRKFIVTKAGKVELAPIKIDDVIFQIENVAERERIEAIAGKGSSSLKETLKSSEQADEVYIVDSRAPDEIFGLPSCPVIGRRKRSADGVEVVTLECATEVFRADSRTPKEIDSAGGCFPFPCDGGHEYDLKKHHIAYKHAINGVHDGKSSAFVSTSASIEKVINFWKRRGIHNDLVKARLGSSSSSANDIIGYIYKIKPDKNFYNLPESYIAARDVCPPDSKRYERLDDLVQKFGESQQYVAVDGFNKDRIIAYTPLRRNDHPRTNFNWTPNKHYNKAYDTDKTSEDLYLNVYINFPNEAKFMGMNLVQKILKIDGPTALRFCRSRPDKVNDWVTKYNKNIEQTVENIKNEYASYRIGK